MAITIVINKKNIICNSRERERLLQREEIWQRLEARAAANPAPRAPDTVRSPAGDDPDLSYQNIQLETQEVGYFIPTQLCPWWNLIDNYMLIFTKHSTWPSSLNPLGIHGFIHGGFRGSKNTSY